VRGGGEDHRSHGLDILKLQLAQRRLSKVGAARLVVRGMRVVDRVVKPDGRFD